MQSVRYHEPTRRALCAHLGARALAAAPSAQSDPWLHSAAQPVNPPELPCGNLWALLNNIKVLHQYMHVLSDSALGAGPYAPALHGGAGACVGGLEWMEPLLAPAAAANQAPEEYRQHVELWRASNPGLFSHAEAAYHVHQGYVAEDQAMTRLVVGLLMPDAKGYEVGLAQSLLRARPGSFDEFQSQLLGWRARGAYHPLCLAARHMPRAEQWAPRECMHEAEDWQQLLDELNRAGFVSAHRLADACERLADRSPTLTSHICGALDRVAALMGVKSDSDCDRPLGELLGPLCFSLDPRAPYTQSLVAWGRLPSALEASLPPSLLCPRLCSSHRDGWGYPRLDLALQGDRLLVSGGRLQWVPKAGYTPSPLACGLTTERLQDIVLWMGEVATSPEIAHRMLQQDSMAECLQGRIETSGTDCAQLTDRARIMAGMRQLGGGCGAEAGPRFFECLKLMLGSMPPIEIETTPSPLNLLLWRIDCPQRALLYVGSEAEVNLSERAPHALAKVVLPDRMHSRTLSGIRMLTDVEDPHTALRACLAGAILAPHADFADHPFHRVAIGAGPSAGQEPRRPPPTVAQTTTTLAETVGVFSGPPPPKHSEVQLHESTPWDGAHIDERYAETQCADNGLRYRDWVTMYRSSEELHRSRLASHHIQTSQMLYTHFPVGQIGKAERYRWVKVASTLPAETRVLRDLGGKTPLESLRRSVENRFMHDTKLLPLWHRDDTVAACDVEIYSDESAQQVAIVYAPAAADGSRRRLELMSFRL